MALSWLPSGRRGVRRAGLAAGTAALLIPLFFGTTPANAGPTGDDTPTVPRFEKSLEPDEELRSDLFARDAYYETRRVAGDQPLSIEQAGKLRAAAAKQAKGMHGAPSVSSFGPWAPAGPNPIVQIGRTSGGAEAVSGRVGALAIQPGTGRLILGAAQGGIWTYDAAAGGGASRTAHPPSPASRPPRLPPPDPHRH